MVVHLRREDGEFERTLLGEEVHRFALHLALDGRALFLVVGNQLGQRLGLDDCTRADVVAQVGGFLDHGDDHVDAKGLLVDELARLFALFDLRVVLGDEVRQVERAGKPGRAAADEDDARFHGVSLDHGLFATFSTSRGKPVLCAALPAYLCDKQCI